MKEYVDSHFQDQSCFEIKKQLGEIRLTLASLFLDLYVDCLKKHPTQKIKNEIEIVSGFLGLPFINSNEICVDSFNKYLH